MLIGREKSIAELCLKQLEKRLIDGPSDDNYGMKGLALLNFKDMINMKIKNLKKIIYEKGEREFKIEDFCDNFGGENDEAKKRREAFIRKINRMGGGGKDKMPKKYRLPNFKTAKRHNSPSPKRSDYEKRAITVPTNEKCIYIDPDNNKRCKLVIGIYPKYCHIHTTLIENLFIGPSQIKNAGNGLYAGPLGFNKNDIIGEYSEDWMRVKESRLYKRNGGEDINSAYVLCDEDDGKNSDVQCWDGLDKNSTIVRNANDAHGSKYKNNAYFETDYDSKGKIHIYMVAAKKIDALDEILCDYGPSYFI
jgi:hypothetical protein